MVAPFQVEGVASPLEGVDPMVDGVLIEVMVEVEPVASLPAVVATEKLMRCWQMSPVVERKGECRFDSY